MNEHEIRVPSSMVHVAHSSMINGEILDSQTLERQLSAVLKDPVEY